MIPVGPIGIVLYYVFRASQENRGATGTKPANPQASKARPAALGGRILLQLFLYALSIDILYSPTSPWLGEKLILIGICILLLSPWWTTRNILVPLRFHRVAYHCMSLADSPFADKPYDSVLAAAWCVSRQAFPVSTAIAWVEGRLPKWRKLGGTTVAAHAMLAAARGQVDEARMLFGSVSLFHPAIVSSKIARVSFEWLATDSAARGEWTSVQHFAGHPRGPKVPTLDLLDKVAKRPAGTRIPAAIEVWLARFGVRRSHLIGSREGLLPPKETAATPKPDAAESLAAVLSAGMEPVHNPDQLATLAGQWQKALSDESLRRRLALRTAANGGGDPAATMISLQRLVESDLVARMDRFVECSVAGIQRVPLLDAAIAARRERLLSEIGDRIQRLQTRLRENRVASTLDEWREFVAIHRAYSNVCASGSKSDRALAFSMTGLPLNSIAVWFYNVRQEKAVANAVFRFLEVEARRTGASSYQVIRKNAAIGP